MDRFQAKFLVTGKFQTMCTALSIDYFILCVRVCVCLSHCLAGSAP